MRSIAVLVLVGALLALLAGCSNGVSKKEALSKEDVDTATVTPVGEPIPEDEKATPGVASKITSGVAPKDTSGVASKYGSAGDILGSWTGRLQVTDQDLAQQLPGLSPEQRAQIIESASREWYSLELRGDGTFSWSMSGGLTWSDTWEMNGETIVLASHSYSQSNSRDRKTGEWSKTVTPDKKPRTLKISSDRAELIELDDSGPGLVFRRE